MCLETSVLLGASCVLWLVLLLGGRFFVRDSKACRRHSAEGPPCFVAVLGLEKQYLLRYARRTAVCYSLCNNKMFLVSDFE